MKVSTVFSAYKILLGMELAHYFRPDIFIKPNPYHNSFRKIEKFEFWLDRHIPAMEKELAEKSRWLRNLNTARGGYSYQQLNLKERKAYLETRRENRRHLRRIRVLEAQMEIYESKLGHAANEIANLLEANKELRKIGELAREVFDTLHGFTQPRHHIFPGGIEVDQGIVEYATRLEKELAAYKSFFTTPGDVWGNRDRWLKGQQK